MIWAKERGINATASVCAAHLTLNEMDIALTAPSSRCRRRCAPKQTADPGRRGEDRRHRRHRLLPDPQDVETKRLPFAEAADGAIGLETFLSAGLRLVHDGSLSLIRMIEAMSTRRPRSPVSTRAR